MEEIRTFSARATRSLWSVPDRFFRVHIVHPCSTLDAKRWRVVPNKARLSIITLDTPRAKHDLLCLAPQLKGTDKWSNIYLTPDLTKAEREAERKLREQLAARRAAGEANITIRKGKIV